MMVMNYYNVQFMCCNWNGESGLNTYGIITTKVLPRCLRK